MKWFFYLCRHTQTLLDSIKCSRSRLFALPAAGRNLLEHKEVPVPAPRACPTQTLDHRPSQWTDFSPHINVIMTEMCAADAFVWPGWRAGGSLGKPLKVAELPYKQGPPTNAVMEKCPMSKTRMVEPACTPGIYKSLFTLVKNSVFFSLDVVTEMQGCGASLDNDRPFAPCIN